MKTKVAISSGGVIFKRERDTILTAVTRRERDIWCLPKGLVEQGESLEDAARREVEEETGLTGRLAGKIGQIDYWFYWKPDDTRYHKFVHFYLLEHTGGDTKMHDVEVEEVKWLPIDEAIKILAYENEKEMMRKARATIGGQ